GLSGSIHFHPTDPVHFSPLRTSAKYRHSGSASGSGLRPYLKSAQDRNISSSNSLLAKPMSPESIHPAYRYHRAPCPAGYRWYAEYHHRRPTGKDDKPPLPLSEDHGLRKDYPHYNPSPRLQSSFRSSSGSCLSIPASAPSHLSANPP